MDTAALLRTLDSEESGSEYVPPEGDDSESESGSSQDERGLLLVTPTGRTVRLRDMDFSDGALLRSFERVDAQLASESPRPFRPPPPPGILSLRHVLGITGMLILCSLILHFFGPPNSTNQQLQQQLQLIPLLVNATLLTCTALLPLSLPLYHFHPPLLQSSSNAPPLQKSQLFPHLLLAVLEDDFDSIAYMARDMGKDGTGDECIVSAVHFLDGDVDDDEAAYAAKKCTQKLHSALRAFRILRTDLIEPSLIFVFLAHDLREIWAWMLGFSMVQTDAEAGKESFVRIELVQHFAENMGNIRNNVERAAGLVRRVLGSLEDVGGFQGVVVPYLRGLAGKNTWWTDDAVYYLRRIHRLQPHFLTFLDQLRTSHSQLTSALAHLSTATQQLSTLQEDCFSRLSDNEACIQGIGTPCDVAAQLDRLIMLIDAGLRWRDQEVRMFAGDRKRETDLGEGEEAPSWERGRRSMQEEGWGLKWLYCTFVKC